MTTETIEVNLEDQNEIKTVMKILNSNSKNFDKVLDALLLKEKIKSINSVSVIGIIKDVKKNGDKALLKYEKRFNKNNVIVPSANQIYKSIKSLDKKVKNAIDQHILEFINFTLFKNLRIFHIQIN